MTLAFIAYLIVMTIVVKYTTRLKEKEQEDKYSDNEFQRKQKMKLLDRGMYRWEELEKKLTNMEDCLIAGEVGTIKEELQKLNQSIQELKSYFKQ